MRRVPLVMLAAIGVLTSGACSTSVETGGSSSSSSSSSGGMTIYCDVDKGRIKPPKDPVPADVCKPGEICGIQFTAEYFSCCVEGPNCCKPPDPNVMCCNPPAPKAVLCSMP